MVKHAQMRPSRQVRTSIEDRAKRDHRDRFWPHELIISKYCDGLMMILSRWGECGNEADNKDMESRPTTRPAATALQYRRRMVYDSVQVHFSRHLWTLDTYLNTWVPLRWSDGVDAYAMYNGGIVHHLCKPLLICSDSLVSVMFCAVEHGYHWFMLRVGSV